MGEKTFDQQLNQINKHFSSSSSSFYWFYNTSWSRINYVNVQIIMAQVMYSIWKDVVND